VQCKGAAAGFQSLSGRRNLVRISAGAARSHEVISESHSRYWFYVHGLQFFLFTGSELPKRYQEHSALDGMIRLDFNAANVFYNFVVTGIKAGIKENPKMQAMLKEMAELRKRGMDG